MAEVHEPSMFEPLKFYCITLVSDGWLNVLHAFQHYFRHIRMVGR